MGSIRIGISGWRYAPWRGVFYPKGLPQRLELEYASQRLSSIELNGSFYSLQRPESYLAWRRETPPGFVFGIKGGRYVTHVRRLVGTEAALPNFFASGLLRLDEKLGPILWQLPPNFVFEPERLAGFLARLPRTTAEAAALAARRDDWMAERADFAIDRDRPLRHALEIRHASFVQPAFVELLRAHRVALVVADTAGKWPCVEDLTADFVYLRLHGDKELYASGYDDAALERWAARIRRWREGGEPDDAKRITSEPPEKLPSRDVYCYFDNDIKVHAPFDAQRLAAMLGIAASSRDGSASPR